MEKVSRDHVAIHITRPGKRGAAVLMSIEDYHAMETTLYLSGNPTNAKLLREGIEELDAGKDIRQDVIPVKRRARRA